MEQVPDYGEHSAEKVGISPEEVFPKLNALVAEAHEAEEEINDLTEKLKTAQSRHRAIVEDALPAMMNTAGVKTFETATGLKITLKDKVATSIPAPRREEAWDWLEKNGHSDILKREVTVAFGVTEGEKAKELAKKLAADLMRSVNVERKAEPATLGSLIRKAIEAGRCTFPRDLFGIRELKVAEIKVPKKK